MALKLHHLAALALGLAGLALSGAPASAHPQYGYGHGYYPRPNPYPRGHGEVVIIQPPVRYAPPPVYYAPAASLLRAGTLSPLWLLRATRRFAQFPLLKPGLRTPSARRN